MKNTKFLIIKIALGISVAAFLFSAVTLIRNIVIGAMIFLSVIQLLGSAVIVLICFALYRNFKAMSDSDDTPDEDEDAEVPAEQLPDDVEYASDDVEYTSDDVEYTSDDIPDPVPEEVPSDDQTGYDLHLFNEE